MQDSSRFSCFMIYLQNKKLFEGLGVVMWSAKCSHRDQTGLTKMCVRQIAKQTARAEERVSSLFISSLGACRYRGMAALQGQYFTLVCAL